MGTHALAELPSWSHVSPTQTDVAVAPPAQCCPGPHDVHEASSPVPFSTVPAGHSLAERQDDWFVPEVVIPAGHGAHWRSIVLDGCIVSLLPLLQTVQLVQIGLFGRALKPPDEQGTQIWSESALVVFATYVPGAQTLTGTHVSPERNVSGAHGVGADVAFGGEPPPVEGELPLGQPSATVHIAMKRIRCTRGSHRVMGVSLRCGGLGGTTDQPCHLVRVVDWLAMQDRDRGRPAGKPVE
jgi:hypothetical protein